METPKEYHYTYYSYEEWGRGYNFVCEFLREKYPKEYYMTLLRDACDVLRDCNKNVPD